MARRAAVRGRRAAEPRATSPSRRRPGRRSSPPGPAADHVPDDAHVVVLTDRGARGHSPRARRAGRGSARWPRGAGELPARWPLPYAAAGTLDRLLERDPPSGSRSRPRPSRTRCGAAPSLPGRADRAGELADRARRGRAPGGGDDRPGEPRGRAARGGRDARPRRSRSCARAGARRHRARPRLALRRLHPRPERPRSSSPIGSCSAPRGSAASTDGEARRDARPHRQAPAGRPRRPCRPWHRALQSA